MSRRSKPTYSPNRFISEVCSSSQIHSIIPRDRNKIFYCRRSSSDHRQHTPFNLLGGQPQRLTHIPILCAISIKLILVWGAQLLLLRDLRHPVGRHAVVVVTVAARCPQQQCSSHHVQRRGDERQVERPAQRAVHPLGQHGHPVEQIHPSQVAAHRGQGAQTCSRVERPHQTWLLLCFLDIFTPKCRRGGRNVVTQPYQPADEAHRWPAWAQGYGRSRHRPRSVQPAAPGWGRPAGAGTDTSTSL